MVHADLCDLLIISISIRFDKNYPIAQIIKK